MLSEPSKLRNSNKCKNGIISPSSDRRKMSNSSLNSPNRDASNGGIIMSLASIDGELFDFLYFMRFRKYLTIYRC